SRVAATARGRTASALAAPARASAAAWRCAASPLWRSRTCAAVAGSARATRVAGAAAPVGPGGGAAARTAGAEGGAGRVPRPLSESSPTFPAMAAATTKIASAGNARDPDEASVVGSGSPHSGQAAATELRTWYPHDRHTRALMAAPPQYD